MAPSNLRQKVELWGVNSCFVLPHWYCHDLVRKAAMGLSSQSFLTPHVLTLPYTLRNWQAWASCRVPSEAQPTAVSHLEVRQGRRKVASDSSPHLLCRHGAV
eukprot:3645427-Amphidinium_carterae.1